MYILLTLRQVELHQLTHKGCIYFTLRQYEVHQLSQQCSIFYLQSDLLEVALLMEGGLVPGSEIIRNKIIEQCNHLTL